MKLSIFKKLYSKIGRRGITIPNLTDMPHTLTLTGLSAMTPELKQQFQERIAGLFASAKKAREADDHIKGRLQERLAKAKIREYKIAKDSIATPGVKLTPEQEKEYRETARATLQKKWTKEWEAFKNSNTIKFPENHYATDHYLKRLEIRTRARATYLAYAYLRNKNYDITETNARWKRNISGYIIPDWDLVRDIIWENSIEIQVRFCEGVNDLAVARKNLLQDVYKWAGFKKNKENEKIVEQAA